MPTKRRRRRRYQRLRSRLRQSEQLVYTAAAAIPDLERRIEQQENLIGVLLGKNPGPITRGKPLIENPNLPTVPVGLPSSILEQRPDIHAAEQPPRPHLQKADWLGALGVFPLVVPATLPVVLPFAAIEDARRALRVSNAIAVVMLFLTGCAFGRSAGHRPLAMGLAMVILGGGLVAITISLGG